MLTRVSRIALGGALMFMLGLSLLAAPDPASAHDADTCDEACQAHFNPGPSQYSHPANFSLSSPDFFSANNRLLPQQSGDKGLHWATAGPKDWDQRGIYNAWLPEAEYGATPRDGREQTAEMNRDLQEACLKGTWPERCFEFFGTPVEITYSYFGNALDYRRSGWGLPGDYTQNWRWTIYLQDVNGGLSWGPNDRDRFNYGSVATVGRMREYLRQETQNADASAGYRYNMSRALVYLDYLYGDDDEHPIEMLTVPNNWYYVCNTPRFNNDGSVMRDFYGNVLMEVYRPITYAAALAIDPTTRAMSCPPVPGGRWEYAYESEIRGWSQQTDVEIGAPYAAWIEVADDSPAGVGRRDFATQSEFRLTPFGRKVQELCLAHGGCDGATQFSEAELAQLEEAANSSQDTTPPKIDLTTSNREALAEGRLIAVSEWAQDARITKHERYDRWMRRWTGTRTYYDDNGNIVFSESHTSEWEYANEPDKDVASGSSTFEIGQRHFAQGYQALVNHCNGTAFNDAVGEYSIDEREQSDPIFTGTHLAGSAVSGTYTNAVVRPWGLTGPTSEVGFYDKVCSYGGTRTDPDTESPTTFVTTGSSAGFRDNTYQELPVSYYTPTSAGWLNYRGDGPLAFTSTRWEGGTPTSGYFWIGGQDCITGNISNGYFGTTAQDPPALTQWTMQDFSSTTVATAVGCYKRLYTRAIWATERARPQVLTVKWDFAPDVATVIPAERIGFTAAGGSTYEKATVPVPVRGQVVSSHAQESATVPADQRAYIDHTGSGTTNDLDVPVPHGTSLNSTGQWTTAPHAFSPYYYALNMVRAVGE